MTYYISLILSKAEKVRHVKTLFTLKPIQGIIILYQIRTSVLIIVRIFERCVECVEVVMFDGLPLGIEIVLDDLLIIGTQKTAPKEEPAE